MAAIALLAGATAPAAREGPGFDPIADAISLPAVRRTSPPSSAAPSISPRSTAASTPIPAPDATSDSVGATVGQFRVDEAGQLSYTIPLYAPPGTAGVMPQLMLSYNSQAGTTPLGRGWSISGLSTVARCRASREAGDFFDGGQPSDGDPAPINFSATDKFCLDGQRLLVVAGIYGAANAEYRLETDPYTRVYSRGGVNGADATYTGPQYFEVQRKDGSSSWYGNTADSRLLRNGCPGGDAACPQRAMNWALNRLQDSTGNYIDYVYVLNAGGAAAPGEITLTNVKYTGKVVLSGQGGTALAPYAQVRFTYDTLGDSAWKVGYQGGARYTQSQRLTGVVVEDQIDTTPRSLRYYKPTYATSVSGSGARLLASIKECRDTSEAVCYPPTAFTWSGARYRFEPDTEQTPGGPNYADLVSVKLGDIDGDGRLDLVWWRKNDATCSGKSRLNVSYSIREAGTGKLSFSTVAGGCGPRNFDGGDEAWQLVDIDGDGRSDLLLAGANGDQWHLYKSVAHASNRATAFSASDSLGVTVHVPADAYAKALLADLNGDGLLDWVYPIAAAETGTGADEVYVRFAESVSGQYAFGGPYRLDMHYGTSDLCYPIGHVNTLDCAFDFFADHTKRSGLTVDMNNDGRADLMFPVTRTICDVPPCAVLRGAGDTSAHYAAREEPLLPPGSTHQEQAWYVFTTGARTAPVGGVGTVAMTSYKAFETTGSVDRIPVNDADIFLADLNGDGLTDLFYRDASLGAPATQYQYRLNTGTGFLDAATLTGVLNGAWLQLADIDGDGRADLLYPSGSAGDSAARSFKVRHWQANAGSLAGSFTTEQDVSGSGATVTVLSQWIHLFADLDGDGAVDFVRAEVSGSGTGSTYLLTSRAAAGEHHQPRDTLAAITNGYGAVTSVAYQPLTNTAIYRPDTGSLNTPAGGRGSPIVDLLAPLYAVSKATSPAPQQGAAGAVSSVYYRYAGAKLQGGGRGFLGFREITTFDDNDSASVGQHMAVRTRYLQEFPFIGSPQSTDKVARAGSYAPDACLANPEALGVNCFYDVGSGGFPDIVRNSADKTVSSTLNNWACNGTDSPSACPTPYGNALCPSLALAAAALQDKIAHAFDTRTTANLAITPTAPQQPVFPYAGPGERRHHLLRPAGHVLHGWLRQPHAVHHRRLPEQRLQRRQSPQPHRHQPAPQQRHDGLAAGPAHHQRGGFHARRRHRLARQRFHLRHGIGRQDRPLAHRAHPEGRGSRAGSSQ